MALEIYRKKRRFNVTSEPRGQKGARGGHRYVIQKHAATRLHYDLRLELDGVMKSWAVTRGPSLDPSEKRLAVHVEDHPIEYNTFEGTIPKGEYGGGAVMIWDRGQWIPDGDPHKAYAKGHLIFDLDGEKLHGRWHLVRMRSREHERHENWLLIKGKDDTARGSRDQDILEERPRSVSTGRSIEEIAAGKGRKRVWHSNRGASSAPRQNPAPDADKVARTGRASKTKPARKPAVGQRRGANAAMPTVTRKSAQAAVGAPSALPDFIPLSLATLYDKAPSGPEWLHEIKFDGYRMEARLDRGQVQLLTRKQQNWTHRFKPIAEAVADLAAETATLDGEIVVEGENGVSNFSLLQTDLKDGRNDRFVYYVFDLLYLDGRDVTGEPLLERKAALARLLKGKGTADVIRYTDHFEQQDGPLILKKACEMGLEGIISKRRDAGYFSGRSDNFIKTKCHGRQEFVVAGYSPSTALPNAVGALTVAVHEDGELRYAGRIGTGYTQKMARALWKRLEPLRTPTHPIKLPLDERRKDVVWVKPELVIEAEFAGVTHGGVLRQASFKGLREDKSAQEVVRERPIAVQTGNARPIAARAAVEPAASSEKTSAKSRGKGPAKRRNAMPSKSAKDEASKLHLTHPDRVYWTDVGVTKKELAEYYVAVWEWMKPHIVNRALAIVRCPDGTAGERFFQKHIASNLKSSPLRRLVAGKDHDVIAVEKLDDLVALVQSGTLEIHTRGSRLDSLETCDRVVFDLDPGEGVAWHEIVAAAREIRERLKAEKLESFVKLSGGKGIHVMLPIADADWDTTKLFTQRFASAMVADSPRRYVAKMTKSLRGGRIFIDYFRNSREATSIAAYATRARAGAPVSAPVSWERLSRSKSGNEFTVPNLKKRLKEDAWAEIGKVRQKLPEVRRGRK